MLLKRFFGEKIMFFCCFILEATVQALFRHLKRFKITSSPQTPDKVQTVPIPIYNNAKLKVFFFPVLFSHQSYPFLTCPIPKCSFNLTLTCCE